MNWADDLVELLWSLADPRIACNEDGVTNYCFHDEHARCASYCCCPCHDLKETTP